MVLKIKLKKGDEVIVLTGKDKGKTGKITLIKPKVLKAIVAGTVSYTHLTLPTILRV